MSREHVREDCVGFFGLPMCGTRAQQVESAVFDGVHEAEPAILAVLNAGCTFQNDNLAARTKLLGKHVAHHPSRFAVVGTEIPDLDAGVVHRLLVERRQHVDDRNARVERTLDRPNQRAGVCRDHDNCVKLRIDVGFRLHAYGLQDEVAAFLFVRRRALDHDVVVLIS